MCTVSRLHSNHLCAQYQLHVRDALIWRTEVLTVATAPMCQVQADVQSRLAGQTRRLHSPLQLGEIGMSHVLKGFITHVQGEAMAAVEEVSAPAVVLRLGGLPPQIQLSSHDIAALTIEALAGIWKVTSLINIQQPSPIHCLPASGIARSRMMPRDAQKRLLPIDQWSEESCEVLLKSTHSPSETHWLMSYTSPLTEASCSYNTEEAEP